MSAESVINNPPQVIVEPCESCGVSEFQLGVKHTEERIIKLLEETLGYGDDDWDTNVVACIALIKGENK